MSGPSSLVVLPPAPPSVSPRLNDLWDDVVEAASIQEVIARMGAIGLNHLTHVAVFFWDEDGMHSLVRGDIEVLDLGTGRVLNTGQGVVMWREAGIASRLVRITMQAVDQNAVVQLPLVVGSVNASAIVVDATATTETKFPPVQSAAQTSTDVFAASADSRPIAQSYAAEPSGPIPTPPPTPAPVMPAAVPVAPPPMPAAPAMPVPAAMPAPMPPEPIAAPVAPPAAYAGAPAAAPYQPAPAAPVPGSYEAVMAEHAAFVAQHEAATGQLPAMPAAAPAPVPAAPAPVPAAQGWQPSEPSQPVGSWQPSATGQREGTVFFTDLAATHKPGGPEADGQVVAAFCSQGHPNPPEAQRCRICMLPVDSAHPHYIARPTLGVLRASTGAVMPIVGTIVVGRAPAGAGEDEGAQLMRVASPSQDISRSHVRIAARGWSIEATDLHSTNGTVVRYPGEAPVRLKRGETVTVEPGTVLELGDGVALEVSGE